MEALPTSQILVDQVYQRLVGAIADRTLQPGQRILQAELALMLGVSRQPVSHALQLLKHQGLLQDSGRKGLEVVPIHAGRIRHLYEVRGALDALSAKLAAGRVQADGAAEALTAALAAGNALKAGATLAQLVQADVAFHRVLYDMSGNPVIPETIAAQWPHFRRSMGTVLEADSYRRRAWSEHTEIARLVLAGDAAGAEAAAYEHAVNAGKETERRLCGEDPPG